MADFIEFSQRDIDRSKLITPGYYRVRIESVKKQLSKAGDSTNFVLEGTVLKNADNGSEEFAGLPTPYWNFNSRAPGFFIGLLTAIGVAPEPGKRYDPSGLSGKEVEIMISNELYEGRMINKVPHQYRAPRESAEMSS